MKISRARYINILLFLFQVFFVAKIFSQTVIPGGDVSGQWNLPGSPYLVDGDISVPNDSTLYIDPGVEVIFQGQYKLDVYGYILASGTMNDSILFTAADTSSGWEGLRLYSIVQLDPDSARLEYCIFSFANNENTDGNGGALFAENSTRVSIQNSTFRNCRADRGGAVYLKNSPVLIREVEFKSNTATDRGGAMYLENSSPQITSIQVMNNEAQVGGGLYLLNSDPGILNSEISYNMSSGGGGGMVLHQDSDPGIFDTDIQFNTAMGSGGGIAVLEDSSPVFTRCSVSYNQALKENYISRGGGVYIAEFDNFSSFRHCVFEGNESAEDGGAVYTDDDIELINCLVINNKATLVQGFGGGAVHFGLSDNLVLNSTFSNNEAIEGTTFYISGGTVNVYNSIVWDLEPVAQNTLYLHNFIAEPSLNVYFSVVRGGPAAVNGTGNYNLIWGEGNQDNDPLFWDPPDNFELQVNSPAVDSGLVDSLALILPATDLNGDPRISGTGVDMGAYEYQWPVIVEDYVDDNGLDYVVFPNPFRDKIFIRLNQETPAELVLDIFTIGGEKIFHDVIARGRKGTIGPVDLSAFPPGTYLIRLRTNGIIDTRKVIRIK